MTDVASVLTLQDMAVGRTETVSWQVTGEEVDAFAELSGDHNPLHISGEYAKAKGFADRVAHGFLLGAKLSGLIGMRLPGEKCLLLEQSLSYPNPVYPGDLIEIRAEIRNIETEFALIELRVRASKQENGKRVTVARGTVTCQIQS